MPLARIGDKLIYFAHIPKTGGTSVEAYLRAKGAVALIGEPIDWARTTPQHLHAAVASAWLPPGFCDHGFCILRDPKARLISEFRMRAKALETTFRPVGLLRIARNRAAGRPTYRVRIGRRLQVADFDRWVERSFAACRADPYYRDNHIRPQRDFVQRGLRLFRFEDGLDPVFRWIDDFTGTPPATGHFHERRADPIAVTCSPATDMLIRDFYRDDYSLIAETFR